MFELAGRELRWLIEDGYVESKAEIRRSSFNLEYRSPRGVVLIGVHLFKSEFNVRVGPPGSGWLSGGAVELRKLLRTIGLDAPARYPPNRASQDQLLDFFMGYLNGLRALRQHEIAGDWTRYDRATGQRY